MAPHTSNAMIATAAAVGLAGAGVTTFVGAPTSKAAQQRLEAPAETGVASLGLATTSSAYSTATGAGAGMAFLGASAAVATLGRLALASAGKRSSLKPLRQLVSTCAFESELGVQPPVGFWDPAGFTADGNVEDFQRRRATEIKHGRVSMLATMGYITPELIGKLPGELSPSTGLKYADIPNGLGAISKVPSQGWTQIFLYCAYVEISQDQTIPGSPASRGDFGFKLLTSSDPAIRQQKLASEIANGRLAMMAIIGMFFQDGLTGSAWGDWANYTESPLRAFESELGVQPPVGFWDPAGFTADGNVEDFQRRRATEIKHGRVSMLATMGYITPELIGKLPGELSPSTGLKYADIPNGLAAISKVPSQGWTQIFLYCAYVEVSQDQTIPGSPASRGDFGFKLLTSSDPAIRQQKLAAEIANGRLAMMAIIGMFFQDGLTGSAWGDWANYTASPLRATR